MVFEDRKEMKKLQGENEKLKFQNLWIQRETQITYFTEQLKKEREERLKLEVALTGDEPIEDLSKEFDIIMKRLSKIKTRTVENSVPRKEYQFKQINTFKNKIFRKHIMSNHRSTIILKLSNLESKLSKISFESENQPKVEEKSNSQ